MLVDTGRQSFADILSRYDKGFGSGVSNVMTSHYPPLVHLQTGCSNNKSQLRNNLHKMCKTLTEDPDIAICVVDAIKNVQMIPATNLNPPTFMIWAINLFNYISNLPGKLCHIVFDVYRDQAGDFSRPSKGRHKSIGERRYKSHLSQQLPPTKKAWEEY